MCRARKSDKSWKFSGLGVKHRKVIIYSFLQRLLCSLLAWYQRFIEMHDKSVYEIKILSERFEEIVLHSRDDRKIGHSHSAWL